MFLSSLLDSSNNHKTGLLGHHQLESWYHQQRIQVRRHSSQPATVIQLDIVTVGAASAQWFLQQKAMLSPMLTSTSPVLAALLLIVAGLFQWTPVRNTCVSHCRSPLNFFVSAWRDGLLGRFR
jgi:Predicted metal-binding integral membrane protein (DUF2182)